MSNTNRILSASGYRTYDYLSKPIFVDKFLESYYPNSLANEITSTVVESTGVKYMQEYVFRKRPRAEWHDYRKNQSLEDSELEIETVTMNVGRAKYNRIKLDELDLMSSTDFMSYINEWRADSKERLSMEIDHALINSMFHQAAMCNKGNAAGAAFGNFQLGVSGNPLTFTSDNILSVLSQLSAVLDDQLAPKQGRFAVLHAHTRLLLNDNPMFMSQYASSSKPLILTEAVPNIAGFKLLFAQNMPTYADSSGRIASPIVAGVKSATYFAMGMPKVESNVPDPRGFGKYWQALVAFDWKVVRPEHLTAAYGSIQF